MGKNKLNHYNENRHVLLLNASYEVIRVINWQRAVNLNFTHKAVAPAGYEHSYSIPTKGGDYILPSALVLKSYVNIPFFKVRPTRKNIFRRDGYVCQYSGERLSSKDATIDHVIPSSRGGKNTWENMVTCSKFINQRKGDRTPSEALMKLIATPKKPTRAELVINAFQDMEPWQQFIPRKN